MLRNAPVEPPAKPGRSNRMLDGRSGIGEACSTEDLSRPAVAIRPERTLRARGALGVVDAFLMWATNDAIHQDYGPRPVSLDELADLTHDVGFCPDIVFREPPL
jgi:hypothetical protein